LRQLEVEFTPLAEARKLKLTFVQTTAWVESDRRLLRRACQNLVSNALKYTRSGGVVVGVRRVPAGPGQDGLGHVEFQVTDQGVGIPASQFKSIFGEFQRLERTAEEVQGIGLGLSIVERVCKTLNLPLKVASVVDKGSTFRIRIPRAAPVVQPVAQELSGTGFATHSGQFTGFNVLLIDNDADILDSMELLLTGWGCKVAKALSTKAALAHLNSTHVVPDLILADYHLGTGTGVTAVLSIHVLLGQQVPAAIITADPSPVIQDEARIIRAPMLRKPLKPGPLRAMISSLAIKQAAE
jgi:CheY-like chemotaxis protein/anti-sigma regulatory factor (Ser/Thr protein kinase)